MTKNENNRILKWAKKLKAINYLGGKCNNCNEADIRILTFHHLDKNEKDYKMSNLINCNWSNFEKELSKCIVLCHNCHQELHCEENKNKYNLRSTINKKVILEYKGSYSCEKCGYNKNIGCLDFHHPNNDKIFNLGDIGKNLTLEKLTTNIIDEINKCEVLCRNCHQLEHVKNKNYIEKYYNEIVEKTENYKEKRSKIDENVIYDMYITKDMRIVNMCKELNLPKSTVSTIIKRLEIKGILVKKVIEKKEKAIKKCIRCGEILDYRNKSGCCLKCKKEYNKKKAR